jgi:vacuolar protein sorting-associated protein 13D
MTECFVLQISFTTLNIRLSYNDLKLFLAIMKTVPDQLIQAKKQVPPPKNAIQCKYQGKNVITTESNMPWCQNKQFNGCEITLIHAF